MKLSTYFSKRSIFPFNKHDLMNESNRYDPPVSDLPRRGKNPVLWVIAWVIFSMIYGGVVVAGDPVNVAILMVYGLGSFAMGVFFANSRGGKKSVEVES